MSPIGTTNPFDQQRKIEGIKHIIAVAAGKGGVGKSTLAANLAASLTHFNAKVGILDADIYGPSIPKMAGLEGLKPTISANRKIEPLIGHGIKTMSIGYLVDDASAIIWRGPMLFKAVDQFLRDVAWGELDYLIVDLPPGTGDVQLSLVQKVPLAGAIIVSTPQDMALIDVRRCIDMFKRVNVRILGLVENMSTFVCPHCHEASSLFPQGKLHAFCEGEHIELLGQIPFNSSIAQASEKGKPFIDEAQIKSGSIEAHAFENAAKKIIALLN